MLKSLKKIPSNKTILTNKIKTLLILLTLTCMSVQAEFIPITGESCPENYINVSIQSAQQNLSEACSSIAAQQAVRLTGFASLTGSDKGCMITETDFSELNTSLCMSTPFDCPPGFQFIRGANTPDHCVPVLYPENLTNDGSDRQGRNVCADSGKGNFSHYRYLYASPGTDCPISEPLETLTGEFINPPPGIKTLFCDEKVQPVADSSGNIIACPFGSELVKGQTGAAHCAFYWETTGLDTQGNDVCRDLGGFKEYQYRLLREASNKALDLGTFMCDTSGLYQLIPSGDKTIICEQEQLPVYGDDGVLISCPDYTVRINGHSVDVPDHCAFINSNLWYGIDKTLDDNGQLVEIDLCWNLGRGNALKRLEDANGVTTLLCSLEDFAHPIATEIAIKEDPTGLQCNQEDEQYIASGNYASIKFRSHCAWTDASPHFLAEGLDTRNVDICAEKSNGEAGALGGTTFSFDGYIFPGGVKTISCSCEGFCPSTQDGDRFKGKN